MTLLYVMVTGNLGPAAAGARVFWTPTGWLTDAPDLRVFPPAPLAPVTIAADGTFTSGPLLAQDSTGPQPAGEAWQILIEGIDGVAPLSQTYTILHANGATQDLSTLVTAVPSPQFTTYLLAANNLTDLPSPSAARTALQLGSAALQPASAFDAAGAASAAQAAAIAASLPTMTVTAVSASGALAIDKVTQVTAASNLTMTLPTPVAGALIVVEREAASATASTVTVSGSIRGAASTIVLLLPNESEMFLGTASTWDPVAGHKTLGSLDARYENVFSPLAFGAKGNGSADDTAAVLACAAAATSAKGVMDLGTFTYKTSSPIPVANFFHLQGAGYGGGAITNSTSALFTITGSASQVTIENCTLLALGSGTAGGHVFDATAGPAMSFWKILGVTATQASTSHGIWNQAGGGWIDCIVDENCLFTCSAGATVSPWSVTAVTGAFNSVGFRRSRFIANGASVPFFNIDPGSVTGWNEEITFEAITWEVCTGGSIWMTGCVDVLISMCAHWDTVATADIYHFATSAAGYPSRSIVVRGGRAGAVTGGANDFFADSGCTNILIESFGSWGSPPTITSPAAQTTILNGTVTGTSPVPTTLPAALSVGGAVSVGGTTGAAAASRYAGATASGHPVSGTWGAGDWVIDLTGSIWICTTGGTPGTWVQLASASSFAPVDDPSGLGFTANWMDLHFTTGIAAGFTSGGANSANYMRLRAAGYANGHISFTVAVASGNMSMAYYTNGGTGASAKPTGGQLATTGAIAVPAAGTVTVALGASVTPHLADWVAMSCDNTTATFTCQIGGVNTTLASGLAWVQSAAHPLPATPSSLSVGAFTQVVTRGAA